MLIISIIMFLRKKMKLRIAYSLLAVTTASVVAYDAQIRSQPPAQERQAAPAPTRTLASAPSISPLADSPFSEAGQENFRAHQQAIAQAEKTAAHSPERHVGSSGVYFLKVAVQFESKNGPVALNRGSRVRLLREEDGKFRVRRNNTDFLIEKSQVTDDLNELGTLARNSS